MKALRDTFTIALVTVCLLLLTVIGLHVALSMYYANKATSWHHADMSDVVKANYSHMSVTDVDDMLEATWTPGWQYENWLGFREKARTSRFTNVSEAGFRLNSAAQSRTEIDGLDWFFGGSTAFGYGVADAETVAARLQALTDRPTLNFGRGYYYSAQENLLLQRLLENGRRPARVIFMDGLNERCDIQTYQENMKLFFERAQHTYSWSPAQIIEPLMFLVGKLSNRVQDRVGGDLHRTECKSVVGETTLVAMVDNSLRIRKALCQAYNIDCITFLQPVAGIHGRHEDLGELTESRRAKLKKKFIAIKPGFDKHAAVDITAALDGHDRHAYIDGVHYSAAASDLVARAIAAEISRLATK